jgi:hypothetical protein
MLFSKHFSTVCIHHFSIEKLDFSILLLAAKFSEGIHNPIAELKLAMAWQKLDYAQKYILTDRTISKWDVGLFIYFLFVLNYSKSYREMNFDELYSMHYVVVMSISLNYLLNMVHHWKN